MADNTAKWKYNLPRLEEGDKIKIYGKETIVKGFRVLWNDGLMPPQYEIILLTTGRGDPFERSLDVIEVFDKKGKSIPIKQEQPKKRLGNGIPYNVPDNWDSKNQSQEQPKQEAIEDIDLEKLALKLGWENAESKEHLKGNYMNQNISAYGYMEGYIKGFKAALLSQQNPNAEKQVSEKIAGYVHEIDSLHISKRELYKKLAADKLILIEKIQEQEIEIESFKNRVKELQSDYMAVQTEIQSIESK